MTCLLHQLLEIKLYSVHIFKLHFKKDMETLQNYHLEKIITQFTLCVHNDLLPNIDLNIYCLSFRQKKHIICETR